MHVFVSEEVGGSVIHRSESRRQKADVTHHCQTNAYTDINATPATDLVSRPLLATHTLTQMPLVVVEQTYYYHSYLHTTHIHIQETMSHAQMLIHIHKPTTVTLMILRTVFLFSLEQKRRYFEERWWSKQHWSPLTFIVWTKNMRFLNNISSFVYCRRKKVLEWRDDDRIFLECLVIGCKFKSIMQIYTF